MVHAIQTAQGVEDRSQQFVSVQGGEDTTSAGTLLVTAYLLMWAALLVFVFLTWRRQRRLDEKIDRLERQVSKTAGD